jgi:Aspartate/tyrosine/aromatic aminotransferase
MSFFKPFALERFFAEYEFSARYLLSSSDCETVSIRELLSLEPGSEERLLDSRLGYTETRGDPALRAGIASLYEGLEPDSILVHTGAEEGILELFMGLLEQGDRAIVCSPCYQSLAEIPRALGCDVAPWHLVETGEGERRRWAFDVELLRDLLGNSRRSARAADFGLSGRTIVVLNAPHNPTGALPTHEEFDAIVEACRERDAILFSDEVYRGLEWDQARRLPAACEAYENGVSLGVLSKSAGLAGLRVGWLASRRRDLIDAAAAAKDYCTICGSGPSETLALVAIRNMDALVERNRAIVSANAALARDFFARRPDFASWTEPEGGSTGYPRLAGGRDAEALARRLVAESGVMLLPGSTYSDDRSRFRLGLGRANFPEALAALEDWIEGRTR